MTLAIGIDPGVAHTGLAILDGPALVTVDAIVTHKGKRTGDTQARLGEVLAWVSDRVGLVGNARRDAIAVEWPVVGGRRGEAGRGSSAAAAAMTFAAAGALIGMLRDRCGLLLAPVPQSWRAAIAQRGETTEQLIARLDRTYAVTALLGKGRGAHGVDAVGLALYGQQQFAAARAA